MPKLLVVDDSALMRRQLTSLFESEGDFTVRTARNGKDAIAENAAFEPDVVTLDINMPEMDGITALSHMMAERPVPVVMVSSLTERGALATFEAMNLGAVDYVAKPGGTISLSIDEIGPMLVKKVRQAAGARLRPSRTARSTASARPVTRSDSTRQRAVRDGVVLIGVSTGGPRTLEEILPLLPADFPLPILVAQHMPAAFTKPFASRLNDVCALTVVEAAQPMPIEAGYVYVGKGGADMVVGRRAGRPAVLPRPEHPEHLWHPSVELLGRTALEHFPAQSVIGVMLTGMGNDGSESFASIKQRGGRTIAESQETAVVFGMPAELINRGGATATLPSSRIAAQLINWAHR